MRARELGVLSVLVASTVFVSGCAAVFRPQRQTVAIRSLPSGAQVEIQEGPRHTELVTPNAAEVGRDKATYVTMRSPGYKTHRGAVPKSVNVGWAIVDTLTCPFTLCVPLMIDAFTSAWVDVDDAYEPRLEPGHDPVAPPPLTAPGAPPPPAQPADTGPDVTI